MGSPTAPNHSVQTTLVGNAIGLFIALPIAEFQIRV